MGASMRLKIAACISVFAELAFGQTAIRQKQFRPRKDAPYILANWLRRSWLLLTIVGLWGCFGLFVLIAGFFGY
jgi:hypothetical protein